jgi:hypothetical protein
MKKILLLSIILPFHILCFAQPSTSSIRQSDKVVLLNGQPFFPIGVYHVSVYAPTTSVLIQHTQQIALLGCNTMHATYRPTLDFTLFLNTAKLLGIYVIVEGMFDYADSTAIINQYKTHPALLGWTVADDADVVFQQPPNIPDPGLLLARQKFVLRNAFLKNLDPNHFTYSTMGNFNIWNNFFGVTDVTSPYTYPIPEGRTRLLRITSLGEVYSNIFVANTTVPNTHCFFGVTQMNREPNLDFLINPTPTEYRNMVYQYIMSNVKGIIPYTFIDGFNFLPNLTTLQAEFAAVNTEIASLSQIFLAGGYQRITTFNSNTNVEYYPDFNGVQASTWYNSNTATTYVIVANTKSQENLPVNVQMPATTTGTLSSVFANRPSGLVYNTATKILSGTVNARDVHVYKFSTPVLTSNDLNFVVQNNNCKAIAIWNKQDDVRGYELEKSNDGILFQLVKNITANAVNDRFTVSTNQVERNIYYRLKIIKLNGGIIYSNVFLNKTYCGNTISFVVFNSDCCTDLKITTTKPESILLAIFNNNGQHISSQKRYLQIGQNTISLSNNNISSGSYIAKVENTSKTIVQHIRFVIK